MTWGTGTAFQGYSLPHSCVHLAHGHIADCRVCSWPAWHSLLQGAGEAGTLWEHGEPQHGGTSQGQVTPECYTQGTFRHCWPHSFNLPAPHFLCSDPCSLGLEEQTILHPKCSSSWLLRCTTASGCPRALALPGQRGKGQGIGALAVEQTTAAGHQPWLAMTLQTGLHPSSSLHPLFFRLNTYISHPPLLSCTLVRNHLSTLLQHHSSL